MVDVLSEIEIRRPRSEVAAYAADPATARSWYKNIKSVTWLTAPPVTEGSRVAFTAEFMRRRLEYTYEICELTVGAKLVMRTAGGPFPMETTYTWEDIPDGTKMTLRNHGEPAGFSRIATPMLAAAMRRANAKDLRRLKTLLESERPAPSQASAS